MPIPEALSPLRRPNFRIYAGGQAISLVGTWMQTMAIGWMVTGLSAKASDLGIMNVVASVPTLVLSVSAGALADRIDKRRILVVTQIGMMLVAFVFAALVHERALRLWHVFALSGVLGVATAYDLPSAQALPPELVEPREIARAVAIMQQIFHGSRLIGPAIAGVLMAWFGNFMAFVANGLSFIAVIASLLVIRSRPLRRSPAGAAGRRGGAADGFAYVRREPLVRGLISLAAMTTGLVFPFLAVLMVYYVRHVLGSENSATMGWLMSASGFGSLAGTIALLWGSRSSRRFWLLGGVFGAAIAIVLLSMKPPLAAVLGCWVLLSFSVASLMGRISQTIQERVPDELRGRVMAVYSMAFVGVMPFAAFGLSALADRVGYPIVMKVAASVYACAGALLLARTWSGFAAAVEPSPP